MPVFSRKQLRRDLAQQFTHDLAALRANGNGASFAANYGSLWYVSSVQDANLVFSGQSVYQNAWLFVEGSTNTPDTSPTFYEYMVATFNAGTGAFHTVQVLQDKLGTQNQYEVHLRVRPTDKNNAIDDTIKRMRIRQEVGIIALDGALYYTIDGAASPHTIDRILDMHIQADPTNSLNTDIRHISDWQIVNTATGNLLRLQYAIQASNQIIMDCILIPSLGGENATINILDERWILSGAAMRCYDLMIQQAPAQQASELVKRRAEWAAEYQRLCARFQPTYDEPIRLHDVVRGAVGRPWSEPW